MSKNDKRKHSINRLIQENEKLKHQCAVAIHLLGNDAMHQAAKYASIICLCDKTKTNNVIVRVMRVNCNPLHTIH